MTALLLFCLETAFAEMASAAGPGMSRRHHSRDPTRNLCHSSRAVGDPELNEEMLLFGLLLLITRSLLYAKRRPS